MESSPHTVLADDTDLPAPYDVAADNLKGWTVDVLWEYGYRAADLRCFEIEQQVSGSCEWETTEVSVGKDHRQTAVTFSDVQEYRFRVCARSKDGTCSHSEPTPWIKAEVGSLIPTGIRKALPSTKQKVFLTWDYVSQAGGYLLEAVDTEGKTYASAHVTNPKTPYALLRGPHPADSFTARVSVLRPGETPETCDKKVSAEQEISLDNSKSLQWTILPTKDTMSDEVAPYTRGVILFLCADETSSVTVGINGYAYDGPWDDHNGHKSAVIDYTVPSEKPLSLYVRSTAPSGTTEGKPGEQAR